MKRSKQNEGTQRRVECPEEVAFLELCRTVDVLGRRLSGVLKAEDLSANQYNVLRILRGAPDGLACGEIGNRMITRDPDITRLLDRLAKRGLISRSRGSKDRRVGTATITAGGAGVGGEDNGGGPGTAGADGRAGAGNAPQPAGSPGTGAAGSIDGAAAGCAPGNRLIL